RVEALGLLRRAALYESLQSFARLERLPLSPGRLRFLAARRVTPANRGEQELAGYRDVLSSLGERATAPFTVELVRRLHRDLYRFVAGRGGEWKGSEGAGARGAHPSGTAVRPGPELVLLHERFDASWRAGGVEPLLLVAAYVLDFLRLRPFLEGNGRMARVLTLLLLRRAGHRIGDFAGLDALVERTRPRFAGAFNTASSGWHTGEHTLLPWWEYYLGDVVLAAYRQFEAALAAAAPPRRAARRNLVHHAVAALPAEFTIGDVFRLCPNTSRPTVHRALGELREQGLIRCAQRGREARWEKTTAKSGT
ncbi:MAG: Fic family protein, partial [Gemmatimonadetes bacterium]|nr:Fic family protein [Gemmatimonadota bacterium]